MSQAMQIARLRLEIHGAVQGVGFRPFVYRLATDLNLNGWVINDNRGVFIEVEGSDTVLKRFLERLQSEKPPLSIIKTLHTNWLEPVDFKQFEIRHSDNKGGKSVLVLPDIATCADCFKEIIHPGDRRYRYPFTNCTNCGPRFSIIRALPYDRPHTSMSGFDMCPACLAEYENPVDRRFHAQPNACPDCGPQLTLYERLPQQLENEGRFWQATAGAHSALRFTAGALRAGKIVAVKGLGGFHLMVDARNAEAIAMLRRRKPRPHKPLAVMARDIDQARTLVELTPQAEALLISPQSPIVLLTRRADAPLAANVAPGNPSLGIMLPYTPLHHLLLAELDFPVIATSGNLSDEPICTNEIEAMERLGNPSPGSGRDIADLFLVHDRPIERHVDDSVAWIIEDQPRLLRRARGYAPLPVSLANTIPTILAAGAHLKNTVAMSVGEQVFISQHIGDLETAEAMNAFERVIADFLSLYEAKPVAIAHDLHPEYLSTKWALSEVEGQRLAAGVQKSEFSSDYQSPSPDHPLLIPVQHHHAHLAAVLAENQVEGPALGVIWDGTGYGTDGTIWGGEFLLGNAAGYERIAHLRPFRLPGGDAAVKEPRRVAFSLLWEVYGEGILEREDLAPIRSLSPGERRLLAQMLDKGLNSPITTSAGRLFDGIASLLDLEQVVTFEGQAAMALEFAADRDVEDAYPMPVTSQPSLSSTSAGTSELPTTTTLLDWQPLIAAILSDLDQGVPRPTIAARFHNTLVDAIVQIARHVAENHVAFSGGCFQNRFLIERAAKCLRENGFEVILHSQIPPNDGGISFGQIAVAAAMLNKQKLDL